MRKIRILNIVPDIYTEGIAVSVKDRQALAAALKEETGGLVELESRIVEGGSESIECFYDSALAAPYILKLCSRGKRWLRRHCPGLLSGSLHSLNAGNWSEFR